MSVVTHPTPLRTPPEPGPKVLDGGAAELWGIVGRACVWRQDFFAGACLGLGASLISCVVDDVWRV